GRLLISHELCVQTSIPRRDARGSPANVAIRGVDDIAFDLHEEVKRVEGRRCEPGTQEAVVGRAAQQRYANLQIGSEIPLGRLLNRRFRIVGIFEANGGALESEIWAPRTIVSDAYNRHFSSSVIIRLEHAALAPTATD